MNVPVVTLNRGRGSGVVARHQVLALLARGHAAYLVHAGEGSGQLPVHEALLTSDILPVQEFLPGQSGRHPQLLGRAVRLLLDEPERRATMAEAGRLRAEARFDEIRLGNQFVDWIESAG